MRIAFPKETVAGERRAAATPDTVRRLIDLGFEVRVEAGLGDGASLPDAQYADAGAKVVADTEALWREADLVAKAQPPTEMEVERLPEGGQLVSLLFPGRNEALVQKLSKRGVTAIALDCVPRITRAQKMDVLSSMANIAGYRAVLEAAHLYGRFFGMQITAAGKTPPARVLVIGAGVAGLSAIATANSLGAEVRAFDVRAAVKEQIQSLGARFLQVEIEESGDGGGGYAKTMSKEFIEAEMALFRAQAAEVDIIITTALIPGKPAPILLPRDIVEVMRPGSVIVDLAAEAGGNCELTVRDEIVQHNGVHIVGLADLTSRLPTHASQFLGTNIAHLLDEMGGGDNFKIDMDNEAIRGAVVLHKGELTWPPPKVEPSPQKAPAAEAKALAPKPDAPAAPAAPTAEDEKAKAAKKSRTTMVSAIFGALLLAGLGLVAPQDFVTHFTVFVLAIFVGWQVVWNVTPALHTPLMSVTNAISGIILIGGLIQAGSPSGNTLSIALGAVAILVATINIAGGFLVTERMLQMFRK